MDLLAFRVMPCSRTNVFKIPFITFRLRWAAKVPVDPHDLNVWCQQKYLVNLYYLIEYVCIQTILNILRDISCGPFQNARGLFCESPDLQEEV